MKKILLLLLSAAIFTSCKKDNAADATTVAGTASLEDASVISTGSLVFASEAGTGLVKIYLRKDGIYVLGLEQMDWAGAVTDTDIYLSITAQLGTGSIKIFSTRNLSGNIYHALSRDINIATLKYLLLQNDTKNAATASAALK